MRSPRPQLLRLATWALLVLQLPPDCDRLKSGSLSNVPMPPCARSSARVITNKRWYKRFPIMVSPLRGSLFQTIATTAKASCLWRVPQVDPFRSTANASIQGPQIASLVLHSFSAEYLADSVLPPHNMLRVSMCKLRRRHAVCGNPWLDERQSCNIASAKPQVFSASNSAHALKSEHVSTRLHRCITRPATCTCSRAELHPNIVP